MFKKSFVTAGGLRKVSHEDRPDNASIKDTLIGCDIISSCSYGVMCTVSKCNKRKTARACDCCEVTELMTGYCKHTRDEYHLFSQKMLRYLGVGFKLIK